MKVNKDPIIGVLSVSAGLLPNGLCARFSDHSAAARIAVVAALASCFWYPTNTPGANETGQASTGSEIFLRYCAGCHGFDGFATYEHAPSFSMGDRLHKSDEELLRSVLDGKHAMPYWQNKLSIDQFRSAIAYLRVMAQRSRSGLPPRGEPLPDMHYKFNPVGEDEDYWQNR